MKEQYMLFLPDRMILRLQGTDGKPVRVSNVLLKIHAFANYKNDFNLQPFVTGEDGVVCVTRSDLEAAIAAHYDSGLMDYRNFTECKPEVEISAISVDDIERAVSARRKIWTNLLSGEKNRWSTIEELIATYERAVNGKVSVKPLRTSWETQQETCEYALLAIPS
jgi:hypothetical protein